MNKTLLAAIAGLLVGVASCSAAPRMCVYLQKVTNGLFEGIELRRGREVYRFSMGEDKNLAALVRDSAKGKQELQHSFRIFAGDVEIGAINCQASWNEFGGGDVAPEGAVAVSITNINSSIVAEDMKSVPCKDSGIVFEVSLAGEELGNSQIVIQQASDVHEDVMEKLLSLNIEEK